MSNLASAATSEIRPLPFPSGKATITSTTTTIARTTTRTGLDLDLDAEASPTVPPCGLSPRGLALALDLGMPVHEWDAQRSSTQATPAHSSHPVPTSVRSALIRLIHRSMEALEYRQIRNPETIAEITGLHDGLRTVRALDRVPEDSISVALTTALSVIHAWPGMTKSDLQRVVDHDQVRVVDLCGRDVEIPLTAAEAKQVGAGITIANPGLELRGGRLWFEPGFTDPHGRLAPRAVGSVDRMVAEMRDELHAMKGRLSWAGYGARRLRDAQHLGASCCLAIGAADVRVVNLRLEGSAAKAARSWGVICTRFSRGARLEGCTVSSFHGGVRVDAGAETALTRCVITRSGDDPGVAVRGAATVRLDDVRIERGKGVGIQATASSTETTTGAGTGAGTIRVRVDPGRGLGVKKQGGVGVLLSGRGVYADLQGPCVVEGNALGVVVDDQSVWTSTREVRCDANAGLGVRISKGGRMTISGGMVVTRNGSHGIVASGRGSSVRFLRPYGGMIGTVAGPSGNTGTTVASTVEGNGGWGIFAEDRSEVACTRLVHVGMNASGGYDTRGDATVLDPDVLHSNANVNANANMTGAPRVIGAGMGGTGGGATEPGGGVDDAAAVAREHVGGWKEERYGAYPQFTRRKRMCTQAGI